MIKRFTEWLKNQIGSIYVWGGQGEIYFNEDWIRKMESSEKNAERAISFYHKQLEKGIDPIAAYDCSGLVVRFLLDNQLIQSDMTASGLYSLSQKTDRKSLSEGDLVFRHNGKSIHHVGVYIGSDMVIHAKGRDVGVIMEHIDANGQDYWNKFGRLQEISSNNSNYPCIMTYTGDSYVNLRDKPSATQGQVIEKVTHNEDVMVLDMGKSGWAEVIKYCEAKDVYKRGFCINKYLKRA